ncbi:metal ABC transporter ATP-binding protein [Candidatus Lokiarchaeum ossiferum]|uniref:metal ABC transporter ATP-binding protein n=1 Tax=Candidatus Lokiarchaeum ossiferum TaxID=2951803 RepID=UPI00352D1365
MAKQEHNSNQELSMNPEEELIRFENVKLGYNQRPILHGINFKIRKGDYIGIIGPNGCGKSTFLKSILNLIVPMEGTIRMQGKKINRQIRNQLGYVPQDTKFSKEFPLSVSEAVLQGRYGIIGILKRPKKEDFEAVRLALHKVHMGKYAKRPIGHLSGGEQQKVMIARALARNPDIILMDEPTSALDYQMTQSVFNLIEELHDKYGLTVLMVHHDITLIRKHARRLVVLDGTIRYDGSPNTPIADEIIATAYNVSK